MNTITRKDDLVDTYLLARTTAHLFGCFRLSLLAQGAQDLHSDEPGTGGLGQALSQSHRCVTPKSIYVL